MFLVASAVALCSNGLGLFYFDNLLVILIIFVWQTMFFLGGQFVQLRSGVYYSQNGCLLGIMVNFYFLLFLKLKLKFYCLLTFVLFVGQLTFHSAVYFQGRRELLFYFQ